MHSNGLRAGIFTFPVAIYSRFDEAIPVERMPSRQRVIDTINTVVQLLILRKVLGLLLGPEGKNSP